jgi:hypothetical protein
MPAGRPPRRPGRARAVGLGAALLAAALLGGCAVLTQPHPPTYTDDELRDKCLRTGGWWRGELIAGYCEYQAPGFE